VIRVQARSLTVTDLAVLGLLGHLDRPISGYEIRATIASSIGFIWAPSKTQLYAVLPRLVAAGLATRRLIEQTERPDKHLYRISPAGRRAIRSWLGDDLEMSDLDRAVDVLLLKVFFARQGDRGAVARQVVALRDAHAARLALYEAYLEEPLRTPDDAITRQTIRLGILRARALLEWAGGAAAELMNPS
jgi:PadR family transcriptional regulator AphA